MRPYLLPGAREGQRLGNAEMIDSVVHDGLWCACENWHMGMTGEAVAEKYGVSRIDQDAYAAASHNKAVAARAAGAFADEILPVTIAAKKGAADDRRSRRIGARGHHAGDARRAEAGVHADRHGDRRQRAGAQRRRRRASW